MGEDINTHYVMLTYEFSVDCADKIVIPFEQHDEYLWLSKTDLLNNKDVHKNTKKYFLLIK